MNEEERQRETSSHSPQAEPAEKPIAVRPRRGSGKHAQRIRTASVRSASRWVLAIAILQLAIGLWFGFRTKGEADQEITRIEQLVAEEEATAAEAAPVIAELHRAVARAFALPLGLGVAFLGLWLWARKSALPALCTALGLYVVVLAVDAAYSPSMILRGVIVKVLCIGALASGIKSALQQRAIAQRQNEPAA